MTPHFGREYCGPPKQHKTVISEERRTLRGLDANTGDPYTCAKTVARIVAYMEDRNTAARTGLVGSARDSGNTAASSLFIHVMNKYGKSSILVSI